MKGTAFAAILALAAPLLSTSAPSIAQESGDDISNKIISVPVPAKYRVDGLRSAPKVRSDAGVQWGKALRVEVPGKSPNPWSVAVAVPITKPVKAGDRLVLVIYARLEKGEDGATTTILPYNAVQMSAAPYTPLFNGPVTIGPEWKAYEIQGKANADYAAAALNVSIHLATAKQVVDVGPVVLLNMGQ